MLDVTCIAMGTFLYCLDKIIKQNIAVLGCGVWSDVGMFGIVLQIRANIKIIYCFKTKSQ